MYSVSWRTLSENVKSMLKGIGQWDANSIRFCNYVSNDVYAEYPWKDTITTIAQGTLPLIDGQQDYNSPINIYRLTKATILRRDTTPFEYYDIDVVDDNVQDSTSIGYRGLRSVSQQQASGTLRLNQCPSVPSGMVVELIGEYQINPVKIVDLNQIIWFKDQYEQVAAEGLLYWGYKLSDDSRAGGATTDTNGRITGYTGQLGNYRAALNRMKGAEDWGASNQLFPENVVGKGRDSDSSFIFWP